MKIIVNIYYTGIQGHARQFAEETVAQIRREEGNLRYDYFFSMEDPETVLLIDAWENQQAIDRHHASPMMKKITELRLKYDLHMKVERTVQAEESLPEDKQFIRE